jgi:hypothetical protein
MSSQYSLWVLGLAIVAANVPFLSNRRLMLVSPTLHADKAFWTRLLEWLVGYVLVGLMGRWFESHLGEIYPQTWEFFAASLFLFATLAFPGFVWCYLRK